VSEGSRAALSLAPMAREWAEMVAGWRYEPPFDVYDGRPEVVASLLDGNHLGVLEDGELVGFVAVGEECRVPGGPTDDTATDLGIGIRPDRRGEGLGTRACSLLFEALALAGHVRLRVSVLASNDWSLALALRLGFRERGEFLDERDGRRFLVLERELLEAP